MKEGGMMVYESETMMMVYEMWKAIHVCMRCWAMNIHSPSSSQWMTAYWFHSFL